MPRCAARRSRRFKKRATRRVRCTRSRARGPAISAGTGPPARQARAEHGSDAMIIDIHGHYTTAPKALETWRNRQIAGITNPAGMPKASELSISDDELRES